MKKPKTAPAPKKQAAPVQTMAELLQSGEPGKALASWNKMKVLVMDPATPEKLLVNAGADEKHEIASLAKLMTFYIAMEKKFDPQASYTVAKEAASLTSAHVHAGTMTGEALLDAMMTPSSNGAAQTIANQLSGDFIADMNATGKRLGLKNTRFTTAHGLPNSRGEDNIGTPRDMAILMLRIQKEFPDAAKRYMSQPAVTYQGHNHTANHFLNDDRHKNIHLPKDYAAEVKTGRLEVAGHNSTSEITGPKGKKLIMVVMNADWTSREKLKEAGISPSLLPKERIARGKSEPVSVKGNQVRDMLVHQMSTELMGGKSPNVAVALPAPAPQAKPQFQPAPPPPKIEELLKQQVKAAPAPEATKPTAAKPLVLSTADMKAVEQCRKTIAGDGFKRPGAEEDAKIVTPKRENDNRLNRLADEKAEVKLIDRKLQGKLKSKEEKKLVARKATLNAAIQRTTEFVKEVDTLENQWDEKLYTKANYDKQIKNAQMVTDTFVDHWNGRLPNGGKPALKKMLGAIVEGAAGMETGWNVEIVKGSAMRGEFTGVNQTGWAYLSDAHDAIENSSSAVKALVKQQFQDDAKLLKLAKENHALAKGMPTTSFLGQGVSKAAMTIAAYKNFVGTDEKPGNDPNLFNGKVTYAQHMMGTGAAQSFRDALKNHPDQKGKAGIKESTYEGNFLKTDKPYAGINDLNPQRIMYQDATPKNVAEMLDNKYLHSYNKLAKRVAEGQATNQQLEAFEHAYFPQWTNNPTLKAQDIARMEFQKDTGLKIRKEAQATVNELKKDKKGISATAHKQVLCDILKPMPPFTPKPDAGLKRS